MDILISYLFLSGANIHPATGNFDLKSDIDGLPGYERAELRTERADNEFLNRVDLYCESGKKLLVSEWKGEKIERFVVGDADGDGFRDILYLNKNMDRGMLLSYDPRSGQFILRPAEVEQFWNERREK